MPGFDGAAQWPGDAEAVESWLRAAVRARGEAGRRIAERARIRLVLDGADIATFEARLDGVDLPAADVVNASDDEQAASRADERVVLERRGGEVRELALSARDVRLDGVPVHAEARFERVPIEWRRYADADPGLDLRDPPRGARGEFSMRIRAADLPRLLETLLLAGAAEAGVAGLRVSRVTASVREVSAGEFVVSAGARVRRAVLAGSARVDARLGVEPNGTITVRDVRIGSRNPVFALAFLLARAPIARLRGTRIDLAAAFAEGRAPTQRIEALRVDVGEDLAVSARLEPVAERP